MQVEYHPAVENELRAIIDHYNQCVPGLGDEFLKEFNRQVLKIAAMPHLWAKTPDGVRRALMRRFPYVLYFRVLDSRRLRITVVKHQRRHPRSGVRRR